MKEIKFVLSLMTPRVDLEFLDLGEPLEANLARLQNQVNLYRVLGGGWSEGANANATASR